MSTRRRPAPPRRASRKPNSAYQWLCDTIASDDLETVEVRSRFGLPPVTAVYLRSLVDRERFSEEVLEPLERADAGRGGAADRRERLEHALRTDDRALILNKVLTGHVALYCQGRRQAYLVSTELDRVREVSEPSTEVQLLGPKDAFTESATTNLNLIRRRLRTPALRVKKRTLGRLSQTEVILLYLEGMAPPDLPRRILDGMSRIDVDFVRGSNDINEILLGRSLTPFPLAQRTERPDRVASALSEGRVAVMVDGSPFVLLTPVTLTEFQRDGEINLEGALSTVFVRWLRYIGITIAILTPGLYAGLLGVDLQVLPPDVLLAAAATREGVPYPILLEIILFLLVLDVVYEASVQSPSPIGQTLTIVGSLIIGQAAVQARLASQLLVIVIAVTAIGSLLTMNAALSYAARIVKYPITLLAGAFGLFGLTLGVVALVIHLASLKSAGVPYLAPIGPAKWQDLATYTLLSRGKGNRRTRPLIYGPQDPVRAAPEGKDESS